MTAPESPQRSSADAVQCRYGAMGSVDAQRGLPPGSRGTPSWRFIARGGWAVLGAGRLREVQDRVKLNVVWGVPELGVPVLEVPEADSCDRGVELKFDQ